MSSLLSMFNKSLSTLKKSSLLSIVFFILFSCAKDLPLTFKDQSIEKKDQAVVDISYPKAEGGNEEVASKINKTVENFLANEINMSETVDKNLTLNEAINGFDEEYKSFKNDFSDTTQEWEAVIEAEVTYESEHLICISVSSYLDTGGAHGNSHVTFLNFDKTTGQLFIEDDIINDKEAFKKLVLPYFEKATQSLSDEETIEDPFFGEGFQLPENIGFRKEGIILLYNVYEIASYAQGVTEFTIPFEKAKSFLKIY
ncbi:MAG: DUF3298 and DUF4163 domain-containing protein [Aquaticitalea sp.]